MHRDDTSQRPPLNRQRVLQAALHLADRAGLGTLTMRRLGAELGVEAMSLYKHVADKEEILDGILELVVGEIEIPTAGAEWKEAMRGRAKSARAVLSRHSWAIGLLEARGSKGRTALRYMDAILGNLRSAGFSPENAAHAFWLLDSYVYGHVIQETSMRFHEPEEMMEVTGPGPGPGPGPGEIITDDYPHLAEIEAHARTSPHSFDNEFDFGLDLILKALDRTVVPSAG